MPEADKNLGKLVSVHGISPAFLQRAVFVAVLAFLFFLAMMFAYYILQSIGYFLLATAFLLIYLVTLFSWAMQRRNQLRIFENGFSYKKRSVSWEEIVGVSPDGEIYTRGSDKILLPKAIQDFGIVVKQIRDRSGIT